MDHNLNILKKENSNVNFPKGEESTTFLCDTSRNSAPRSRLINLNVEINGDRTRSEEGNKYK